jgi:hypothetical protein
LTSPTDYLFVTDEKIARSLQVEKDLRAKALFDGLRPSDPLHKPGSICSKCGFDLGEVHARLEAAGGIVPFGFTGVDGFADDSGNRCEHSSRPIFRVLPAEFLKAAERRPPRHPEATVSGFSQWIYSLYSTAYGSDEDRERGKEIEPRIFARRIQTAGYVDDVYLNGIQSDWRLRHNGLHLPGQEPPAYFTIDHLRVKGEPVRAVPDLVYRNQRLNETLIVEIKYSHMAVPLNLWPNIWGQLWCYSQIDLAHQSDRVSVVGEVWSEKSERYGPRRGDWAHYLFLRESVRRDPRKPAFDKFFSALFDIYANAGR